MNTLTSDTLKGRPCAIPITTRTKTKTRRKQRLVAHEMLSDAQDCSLCTPCVTSVFKFPKLDFGMAEMSKAELEQALADQLYLHSSNSANDTGIDHPNPKELTSDIVTEYQSHRLAAVSWFANVVPFHLVSMENHHSVLMPAVNVMDRYITTCTDLGEDLCQLLTNIGNIRLACLSLAIKMHTVYTEFDLEDFLKRNDWVNKALVIDSSSDTATPKSNVFILPDVQGIQEAENLIISKLKGAVFPANGENMISVLCKYLILEHLSWQTSHSLVPTYLLNQRVMPIAARLFATTALDIRLLRFRRWKCIAVCCLLGVIEVCAKAPGEGRRLEESLISLLEKLKPGQFTKKELCDLSYMLIVDCVVCRSCFINPNVHKTLRKISSMSCSECSKGNRIVTTRKHVHSVVAGDTNSQGEPDNKVTRCIV